MEEIIEIRKILKNIESSSQSKKELKRLNELVLFMDELEDIYKYEIDYVNKLNVYDKIKEKMYKLNSNSHVRTN